MHINIICINNESMTLEVSPCMSIIDIKNLISLETGVMCNDQKLIINKKLIEDNTIIGDLNINEGANFDLVIALHGGSGSHLNPAIKDLSKKYNHNKKICRKCYATLPPRATNCRKKKCGHSKDLRPKKPLKIYVN